MSKGKVCLQPGALSFLDVEVETFMLTYSIHFFITPIHVGKESTSRMLSYCGRLPVGVESSGVKPTIFDVSWNRKLSSKFWGQADDAIACTGTFGTCIFVRSPSLRSMNLQGNIDDGWTKVVDCNIVCIILR